MSVNGSSEETYRLRDRFLDLLRRRPEAWFLASVLLSAAASFTALGQPQIGPAVLKRLSFASSDPILPFTLVAAVISGATVFQLLHRRVRLGLPRSLLIAVSVPVGAVGAFEIPYQAIRGYVFPGLDGGWPPVGGWIALTCWVIVGLTGMGFVRVDRRFALLSLAVAAGFLAWWAAGFPQVTSSVHAQVVLGYLFNVPLKVAVFALLTLLFIPRAREAAARDPRTRASDLPP